MRSCASLVPRSSGSGISQPRLTRPLSNSWLGVTVVPAGLWGTDHVIPVTNEGVRYGQTIQARFGTPVLAKDHQTPDAFTEAIWGQVRELVTELAYSEAPPTSNM